MKMTSLISTALITLSSCMSMVAAEGVPASALENREERMEWWRDAKFGMFVHYGLYSGLSGEFEGKKVSGAAEWIQQYTGAETDQYFKAAYPKFTYKPGMATKWVELAKEAGCGYIVMTTRHHEGFNLYDTRGISSLNSVEKYGVDIVKEFAKATKELGLKTGYYFSLIDWNHPDYDPTGSAISYPSGNLEAQKQGRRQFGNHERYKEHLFELFDRLVSKYPVDIIWWDYSTIPFQGDKAWGATHLMETLFKNHPMAIQNNRLYCLGNSMKVDGFKVTPTYMGDFSTPEHYIPAQGIDGDWEVGNTLNGTWGYSSHNHNWRTGKQVTRELIDIVSRGGNYLLNIGPKADGSIPEESIRVFKEVGAWVRPNAEAIYGTEASPFAEEPAWGRVIRKGDNTLYLMIYEKPQDGKIVLPARLSEKLVAAPLLKGRGVAKVILGDKTTTIDVSKVKFEGAATVVKLTW